MKNKLKVLVIAYIFPPLGGSGVQRTTKFVKYLPQFGWEPLVVCGDNGEVFGDGYDPTLLAEIPAETKIWRVPFVSPLALRRGVQRRLGIQPQGGAHTRHEPSSAGEGSPAQVSPPVSLPRRLANLLALPLHPFEFPPVDAALYWALSIIPLCRRIITREKVDVIYTTSFPYSDHVTGLILKRLTGLPWVADFRDPWTQNASAKNEGWRRAWDQSFERKILNAANVVIAATPSYTQGFRQLAKNRPARDFITIENGYDENDLLQPDNQLTDHDIKRSTVIAHVGLVYDGTLNPFLNALKQLDPPATKALMIQFVGGVSQTDRSWIRKNLPDLQCEVIPRVPHQRAIQYMREADVVLLPIGSGQVWQGHYPGKLFEYMASGTPILMLGPDGDAAHLVRESGTGYFISASDPDEIVHTLRLLAEDLDGFVNRFYRPNWEIISCYERKALTQRLASAFNRLVNA